MTMKNCFRENIALELPSAATMEAVVMGRGKLRRFCFLRGAAMNDKAQKTIEESAGDTWPVCSQCGQYPVEKDYKEQKPFNHGLE